MRPSVRAQVRERGCRPRCGRVGLTWLGRGGRLLGFAIGALLFVVPGASASHRLGTYEGTQAHGGLVRLTVAGPFGSGLLFESPPPIAGKTDLGQDCWPLVKPPGPYVEIVDHAFSATRTEVVPGFFSYTVTVSGSFSEPHAASGTLRITSDRWTTPVPDQPPLGSICDTGTLGWTASCTNVPVPCSAPMPQGGPPPSFSGSGSRVTVSTSGQVTLPLRIACPPPGAECRVSVAATARVPASATTARRRVTLGRSHYVVKVARSAKTRFELTTKGRRLLRRLRRIKARVEIAVTRDTSVTERTVTVSLKAPRRTR